MDDQVDPRLSDETHPLVQAEAAPPEKRRYRSKLFQLMLLAAIALFAGLTYLVEQAPFFPVDVRISRALQMLAAPPSGAWVTPAMDAVSWPGYLPQSVILVGLVGAALFALGLRWEALTGLWVAGVVMGSGYFLKLLIHRPRPSADLVQVMKVVTSYSFPSGHVVFYTGFFGFLWYLAFTLLRRSWKRTLLLVVLGGLVALVGPSRIYLGAHWASDVLGAYLLGFLLLWLMIQVYRWGKGGLQAWEGASRGKSGGSGVQ